MPWNIQHSFELALQFSTHTEMFNMLFQHSFQHILQFSTCLEIFKMFFNIPWNIQHSFEPALQFSTCTETFNTLFQHALQFSEHTEMFNMLFYSFQNMLKISTCFFTVFRTCWKFQHAFLQFSTLFFNMFLKSVTDFNTLWNFQHTFKHENLKHLESNCNWIHPEIFIKS